MAQLLLERRPHIALVPSEASLLRDTYGDVTWAGFPGGCRHRALLVCSVASPGAKTYREEKKVLGERA